MTSEATSDNATQRDGLTGAVFLDGDMVTGFVVDRRAPRRRYVVELLLDGWPCKTTYADAYDHRSPLAGEPPDNCHGFAFSLPSGSLASEAVVRVANTERTIGQPLDVVGAAAMSGSPSQTGRVAWEGGLRVGGWIAVASDEIPAVHGIIAETIVFDVRAVGWELVHLGDAVVPHRRFEADLPACYADGKVHQVEVFTSNGVALDGSPLSIVAFEDGLEHFLLKERPSLSSERARARLFDELMPRALPLRRLDEWQARFPLKAPPPRTPQPAAIVLFGDGGVEESLVAIKAIQAPWTLGVIPLADDELTFDTSDLLSFLEGDAKDCSFVVFARAGAQLHHLALDHLQAAFAQGAHMAHSDFIIQTSVTPHPITLSAYDPERCLEQAPIANFFAVTLAGALEAALSGAVNPFSLLAAAIDHASGNVIHLPGFLATCPQMPVLASTAVLARLAPARLKQNGITASAQTVAGDILPAVRVRRAVAAESITILLPVRNRREEVRLSVEAIRALSSRHRVELQIIDMASSQEATLRYLGSIRGQHDHVERVAETANVAHVLNDIAATRRSRFLLILESGNVVPDRDWLDELVARCAPSEVAAAGPVLVASDVVVAAGMVLDVRTGASAVAAGCAIEDPHASDLLRVARSCSALPLPGLLVKRHDFMSVGGFDADRFGRAFHSIDVSLKLRKRQKRLVVSPHIHLALSQHSAALQFLAGRHPAIARELDAFRAKWGNILSDDEFYSPSLASDRNPYWHLAWPPRTPSLHSE